MKTKKQKPAAKKATSIKKVKKVSKKKITQAKASSKATKIPQGREHKLAEQTLKLVDEAASLLRSGIRESAATTAKSRIAAKKKAHDLLGKASSNLSKALEEGTSVLQDLIKKI